MSALRLLFGVALLLVVAVASVLLADTEPERASANAQPVQVVAGWDHTCALTPVGGVKCWGSNEYGQLGDNTEANSTTPVDVCNTDSCATLLSGVTQLAAGSYHTCARIEDGGVKCWGENGIGQVGDGHFCDPCRTPQDVCGDDACLSELSGVLQVSAGWLFTCGHMSGGGVKCWGHNGLGQLGNGNPGTSSATPVNVCEDVACAQPIDDIVAIDSGREHTCVLQRRPLTVGPGPIGPPVIAGPFVATFDAVMCWGSNDYHELAVDDDVNCDFGPDDDPCSPVPVDVCADSSCEDVLAADAVSTGGEFTCALLSDTSVECWGSSTAGQAGGLGTVDYPMAICANESCGIPLSGVSAIATGDSTACVITSQTDDDGLKCWGSNFNGQIGIGEKTELDDPDIRAPVEVCRPEGCSNPLVDVVTVGLGRRQTCAVAPGPSPIIGPGPKPPVLAGLAVLGPDTLMCWGDNENGQLGDGTTTQRTLPVAVGGIKPPSTPTDTAEPGEPTDTPEPGETPAPTDTPASPELVGDVDCSVEINAIDAAFLLQLLAGLITELPCPDAADVNGDGETNAVDAALILQFSAGLISSLPP